MIRSLILLGFTYLLFQLHLSGDISKYINMKYSYLSAAAGYALLVLTIVQFFIMAKKDKEKGHVCDQDCCCGHSHEHESKWYQKLFLYPLFAFPIVSGLFLPIATLDSSIVKTKGFHFPMYDAGKGDIQQQFLRPDTSIYYDKNVYDDLMNKEKKQYVNQQTIVLDDIKFLPGMETIYNFPGEFLGKEVQFKGFAYNDPETINKNQLFVFRFGIIHCIADSGVYGMLVEMPDGVKLKNDQWVTVTGKISSIYYQPFKSNIPYLKVDKWVATPAPKDPYVYRQG
ncbi:TIGR03943 family putative permease subunit [Neobacillus sp. SM06]|uniref:TIGR03943 family putative permease subunit n=1 Tax=Neobacillus sp. SM06 TaxID=3422492 RepID=UPI003D2D2578